MEDIFLLPKAKAPVIFKVKTASALEFHIQFGVSKIGFAYSTPLPLNLEGIRGFFFLKYTS